MTRKGKGKGKRKGKKRNQAIEKRPRWLELPEVIWVDILQRLGAVGMMLTAEKVCTTWRRLCKDPSMWRVINMNNCCDTYLVSYFKAQEMCRRAVDRSQGELVDINMEYFATDELLAYVAERSGKLKRLGIACCYDMVHKDLVEAVQKFPLLEELSLTHTTITTKGIEAIRRSCPRLKSFDVNNNSCFMCLVWYSDY
ncbi:putative F-box protein At4g05475 [Nicotiana tabacum]|uniref:F-box protein At4g05475 n=1 Tax=Nicotiana tabacum TaxID=4097 RepID=A0A1S4CIL1_TOBAC|nr:PREDICTED: putative F-box protein At4g05475 [Nicotiana tabacum]